MFGEHYVMDNNNCDNNYNYSNIRTFILESVIMAFLMFSLSCYKKIYHIKIVLILLKKERSSPYFNKGGIHHLFARGRLYFP